MPLNDWLSARAWHELALVIAALSLALTAIGVVTGFTMERAAIRKGRQIYAVPIGEKQLAHEALGTALFHVVSLPIFTAAVALGWVRFSSWGWRADVLTVPVTWLGFQFLYYWLHRAMHTRPLRWMHLWHHESRVTTPLTGFSMHPAESAAWCVLTLIPIVALSFAGALGPWGLAVFFYMQWVGNIAGHANAEIFPMPVTRASSFAQNALTYHCLHHARYDRHYGFAAATMDYLFGTEWPDWLAAFQRVSKGKPLTSLSERVEREG